MKPKNIYTEKKLLSAKSEWQKRAARVSFFSNEMTIALIGGERKSIGDIYDDLLFTTETDLVQKYYNLLILDLISFQ